jgi:hypothetical protein
MQLYAWGTHLKVYCVHSGCVPWGKKGLDVSLSLQHRRYGYRGLLLIIMSLAGRQGVEGEERMVRDNWFSSVTWDEWEGGVREHVDKLMART